MVDWDSNLRWSVALAWLQFHIGMPAMPSEVRERARIESMSNVFSYS
jgi:hypothetical protein